MADEKKGLKYFEDLGATIAETAPPPSGKVQQGAMPPTGATTPPSTQQAKPDSAFTGKGVWSMLSNAFGSSDQPGPLRTALQLSVAGAAAPGVSVLALPGTPPIRETAKAGAEFLEGAVREGALSIPGQVMSLAGIDPSKVKVPYAEWSDLIPGAVEKKEGDVKTFRNIGEAPPSTAGKIGGMAGTALQFGLTRGKLGVPQLEAKTFALANKILPQNPKLANFLAGSATSVADGVLTAAQAFSKTMDPDEALSTAGWSTLIDMGLRGVPSAVKSLIDKNADVFGPGPLDKLVRYTTWDYWAKSALPRIEKIGKDPLEYQQTLVKKMGERKYDFTKQGKERLDREFGVASDQMKKASKESDEVLSELYNMGAIPPEALRPVDYKTEVRNAIYGIQEDGRPLFKKVIGPKGIEIYEPIPGGFSGKQIDADAIDRVRKAAEKIDEAMPKEFKLDAEGNAIPKYRIGKDGKPVEIGKDASGNPIYEQELDAFGYPKYEYTDEIRAIDFDQAEFYKQRINMVIQDLYDSGFLNPADKIDKQVKLLYANAIRKAQKKAFDLVASTKKAYESKIPASSPIKNINPGDVKLPWLDRPLRYSDAGQEAMELADLYTVSKMAQEEFQPHLGAKSAGEMQKMIGISQFIHGSILTPSQLASAYSEASTAVGSSLTAKRLKAISNMAGKMAAASPRVSKGFAGARSTTPPSMTEWVQQQAAPAPQDNQWTIEQ